MTTLHRLYCGLSDPTLADPKLGEPHAEALIRELCNESRLSLTVYPKAYGQWIDCNSDLIKESSMIVEYIGDAPEDLERFYEIARRYKSIWHQECCLYAKFPIDIEFI